jgi:hypothetical protein
MKSDAQTLPKTSSTQRDGIMTNKNEPRLPVTCAGFDVAIALREVFNWTGCADFSTITHRPPGRPERPNSFTTPRLTQGVTDGEDFKDGEPGAVDGELPLPRVRLLQ